PLPRPGPHHRREALRRPPPPLRAGVGGGHGGAVPPGGGRPGRQGVPPRQGALRQYRGHGLSSHRGKGTMNDTMSVSMHLRRGARRWGAVLASVAVVATMARASAENGRSDGELISRAAWGVYSTSRSFRPCAERPWSLG